MFKTLSLCRLLLCVGFLCAATSAHAIVLKPHFECTFDAIPHEGPYKGAKKVVYNCYTYTLSVMAENGTMSTIQCEAIPSGREVTTPWTSTVLPKVEGDIETYTFKWTDASGHSYTDTWTLTPATKWRIEMEQFRSSCDKKGSKGPIKIGGLVPDRFGRARIECKGDKSYTYLASFAKTY